MADPSIDPALLQELMAAGMIPKRPMPQQPSVPLSDVYGPNGEQMYAPPGQPEPPSSELMQRYRSIQPYPINPAAMLEGALMSAGGTGGPAGAIAGPAKEMASSVASSPLARALAGTLGFGSVVTNPTEAGPDKPASAGQSVAPNQENLKRLLEEKALLTQQVEDARQRREKERKTGQGNNYQAADREFQTLNRQLEALTPLIATEQKRGSPEAILDAKKAQDDFARKSRERDMNTSVKEMLSDVMPYVPMGSAAAALGLGGAIKGNYVSKFNDKMDDMVTRWEQAVNSGNKPLAQQFETKFNALNKAGPGGTLPAIGAGVGVGEFGQVLPVASDYAKSLPGSDLYNKTIDTMSNPWEVGGRVVTGAMLGGIPAEIAALLASRGRSKPLGFGPETGAMPDQRRLPPPLPPNNPPIEGGPLTPVPGGPLPGGGGPELAPPAGRTGAFSPNQELIDALKQNPPANVNAAVTADVVKTKDGRTIYQHPHSKRFMSPPDAE